MGWSRKRILQYSYKNFLDYLDDNDILMYSTINKGK